MITLLTLVSLSADLGETQLLVLLCMTFFIVQMLKRLCGGLNVLKGLVGSGLTELRHWNITVFFYQLTVWSFLLLSLISLRRSSLIAKQFFLQLILLMSLGHRGLRRGILRHIGPMHIFNVIKKSVGLSSILLDSKNVFLWL